MASCRLEVPKFDFCVEFLFLAGDKASNTDPEMLLAVLTLAAADGVEAEEVLLLVMTSRLPLGSMMAFITAEKKKKNAG